jgi:hypothetical protein
MKPIEFKGFNKILAKDQPQYQPLPVLWEADGRVISCWKLSLKERLKVLFGGKLWLSQLTFNQKLQPQLPLIDDPIIIN